MGDRYMKKWLFVGLTALLLASFVFMKQTFPLGNVISMAMTPQKEVYVLYNNADKTEKHAALLKLDSKGNILFQTLLPYYKGDICSLYRDMTLDSKGNVFLRVEAYDMTTMRENRSAWSLVHEEVISFDFNGNAKGTQVSLESQGERDNRILKLQVQNDELLLFARSQGQYLMTKVGQSEDTPDVYFPLDKALYLQEDALYIQEIARNNRGDIVYTTGGGQLFLLSEGILENIGASFGVESVIRDFSLDDYSNIYFTEQTTGGLYQYQYDTKTLTQLYTAQDTLTENILFSQVKNTDFVAPDFYSAISIVGDHWFFVGFGQNESFVIDKINPPLSDKLLPAALTFVLVFLVCGLCILGMNQIRVRLTAKIISIFVPVYILSTLLFGYVIVRANMDLYMDNLYQLLQAGSRAAQGHVPAWALQNYAFQDDYMSEEFAVLKTSLENGIREVDQHLYAANGYMVLYQVKNGQVYTTATTDLSELTDRQVGVRTVEYMTNADTCHAVYELISRSEYIPDSPDQVIHLASRDYVGSWIGVMVPIKNEIGQVVGLVENGVNRAITYDVVLNDIIQRMVVLVSIVTVLVFLLFFVLLKFYLRPLPRLQSTMQELVKGRWDSKVSVTTRDELGNIGNTFNLMTSHIRDYIHDFMVLNRAYVKFIPDELIKLLDKKDVVQAKLFDSRVTQMHMLLVDFNPVANQNLQMSPQEYFQMMNQYFDVLFDCVQQNGGIIERFDGMGMLVLFDTDATSTLKTALQFQEVFERNVTLGQTVRMIMSSGETLIGIAGNEERNSITTVSPEIMQIYALNNHMNRLDMQYLLTEEAMCQLHNMQKLCRFVGNLPHVSRETPCGIYELIGATGKRQETKAIFEQAVHAYLSGELLFARKRFIDVLRIHEDDRMAMHYLALCDTHQHHKAKDWKGFFLD